MARPKVKVIGKLQLFEDGSLRFSLEDYHQFFNSLRWYHSEASLRSENRLIDLPSWEIHRGWFDAVRNAYNWDSLGKFPSEEPKRHPPHDPAARQIYQREYDSKHEKWLLACSEYTKAVHSDERYRKEANEIREYQAREPYALWRAGHSPEVVCFLYRDKVVQVEWRAAEVAWEDLFLLVKHHILRNERNYEKIRREVEALENLEKLQGASREPIPDSVRLFVWQRDKGQCVKCGSRERLEFDHIIPIAAGGSNTERNVQLLCEACNRSKGATI
jgi:5-methylcytosine-specific restriction endonuclease McrA